MEKEKYILVHFQQQYGEFEIDHYYTYKKKWYDKKSLEEVLCQFYCCDKEDLYCADSECNKTAAEGCDCDYGEYEKGDTVVSIYGEEEIDEYTAELLNKLGMSYIHHEKEENNDKA